MTTTIEQTLDRSHNLLTVREIMRESGRAEEVVRAELRRLANIGLIEHIPGRGRYDGRYGLTRPIAKSDAAVTEVAPMEESEVAPDTGGPLPDFAGDSEPQHQAPQDYRLPDADPQLLAMTNRTLREQLDAALADLDNATHDRNELQRANEELRIALATEREAAAVLREELDLGVCREAAPVFEGYVVVAPKRPIKRFSGDAAAVKSALAAASNGSARGDVFGLVLLGSAKRGAVYREASK